MKFGKSFRTSRPVSDPGQRPGRVPQAGVQIFGGPLEESTEGEAPFHKHPELKELMALKTFERAWEELHMKKPRARVSRGTAALLKKVGLVRRVFELLPEANEQGDVLKDVSSCDQRTKISVCSCKKTTTSGPSRMALTRPEMR